MQSSHRAENLIMHDNFDRRFLLTGSLATLAASPLFAKRILPAGSARWTMTQGIRDEHVGPATRWLMANYGDVFRAKVRDTSVPLALLCAIACQESAYTWFDRAVFVHGRTPAEMMRLLVLDNVSPRAHAFPRDTAAFIHDGRYADIAQDLIAISDASRQARGYPKTGNLLYGYGLFQYDLQNIETDPSFWRDMAVDSSGNKVRGLWGDVGACTDRFIRELSAKLKAHPGDLAAGIAAYNGSGGNARAYSTIVLKFMDLAAKELGS